MLAVEILWLTALKTQQLALLKLLHCSGICRLLLSCAQSHFICQHNLYFSLYFVHNCECFLYSHHI